MKTAAVCSLLAMFSLFAGGSCNAEGLDEYKIKVAFIYNFAKFVSWPPKTFQNPESPIVFCILGEDPFGSNLSAIENKQIGERKFVVKRIRRVEDSIGYQIIFISRSEKDRLETILPALRNEPILTVSDIPNFTRLGGMIGFTISGDKVRFEINLGAARSSKLEISSKLLKLAETVIE